MHKITKTFELEHKDYCNGCPCLRYEDGMCKLYQIYPMGQEYVNHSDIYTIRPNICKQESEAHNGK